MCGAKLEQAIPVSIDDNDPLDLEAPVYSFEDRSRAAVQGKTELHDRQRERVRDSAPTNRDVWRTSSPVSTSVDSYPPDTVQEEMAEEAQRREAPRRVSGIGGPSFLGLGYEGSNNGFVYDKPRNDGFVYDTDGETPEYLLEEAPRRSSWRAWALALLLVVGGALGYIQWRASHNEGPDLASILSGNGASIDANHPTVASNDAAKPPAPKPAASAADATKAGSAKDSDSADSTDEQDGAEDNNVKSSAAPAAASSSKSAGSTSGNGSGDNSADHSGDSAKTSDKTDASADAKETDEKPAPDSHGVGAAAIGSNSAKATPVEDAAPQPKSLGDKDPLIIEANKYLQGRGVRQNCSTGVNLLRQAISEGNPEASVKMGALYWSGTCVTQSNVTAYEWFSRAHSLDPRNRWIERSRNSVWASMSPAEKQRTTY